MYTFDPVSGTLIEVRQTMSEPPGHDPIGPLLFSICVAISVAVFVGFSR